MRTFILLFSMLFLNVVAAQDCTTKIKTAQATKEAGKYRLALAQFIAAASTCGNDRKEEIEKEILDIYDQIERIKDDAVIAQNLALVESERSKKLKKSTEEALVAATKANLIAKNALDSLQKVMYNLNKANEDKVRLILKDAKRDQHALLFEQAIDKIGTAKILNALLDSVNVAQDELFNFILLTANQALNKNNYEKAIDYLLVAEQLNRNSDSIQVVRSNLYHYLVKSIASDIQNINLEVAYNKLKAASSMNFPTDTLYKQCFEVAFCQIEIEQLEQAKESLNLMVTLRSAPNLIKLLEPLNQSSSKATPIDFKKVLTSFDPSQNEVLRTRYFPLISCEIPSGILQITDGAENTGKCSIPVNSFLLGSNEVTFAEYDLYCKATNRPKPTDNNCGRGKMPVIDVCWYDALEYCNWRSRKEKLAEAYKIVKNSSNQIKFVHIIRNANGYRLPTESEWMFAAGNGNKQTKYSWGNDSPKSGLEANLPDQTLKTKFDDWDIFKTYVDGYIFTAPVGTFGPNDFGLNDMTGNVWEWCWDQFNADACFEQKETGATPLEHTPRILKGGSWGSFPWDCLVNSRLQGLPNHRNFSIGFRLARSL